MSDKNTSPLIKHLVEACEYALKNGQEEDAWDSVANILMRAIEMACKEQIGGNNESTNERCKNS